MENRSSQQQASSPTPVTGQFRRRKGAKALVTRDGTALLVRERHADGTPFWTLPGGGVDTHESAADGLRRELVEELHCRAHVAEPVSKFWYIHHSCDETVSVYTVFDCELRSSPTPNRSEGILEHRWVDPQDPPTGTLPQVQYVCERFAGQGDVAGD